MEGGNQEKNTSVENNIMDEELANNCGTLLHSVSMRGDYGKVKFLIDNKANVNAGIKIGETPLRFASINGHYKVAKLLIDNGADLDAVNKYDEAILMCTLLLGQHKVAKLLIDRGAKVNIMNKKGLTALDYTRDESTKQLIETKIKKETNDELNDGKNLKSQAPIPTRGFFCCLPAPFLLGKQR